MTRRDVDQAINASAVRGRCRSPGPRLPLLDRGFFFPFRHRRRGRSGRWREVRTSSVPPFAPSRKVFDQSGVGHTHLARASYRKIVQNWGKRPGLADGNHWSGRHPSRWLPPAAVPSSLTGRGEAIKRPTHPGLSPIRPAGRFVIKAMSEWTGDLGRGSALIETCARSPAT